MQNTKEGLILSIDNSPADFGVIEQLSLADLLAMIQRLPIGFRTVFNLYAVEGFTHQEIAENLGIAEGTSKCNTAAKQQLVAWIEEEKMNEIKRLAHQRDEQRGALGDRFESFALNLRLVYGILLRIR